MHLVMHVKGARIPLPPTPRLPRHGRLLYFGQACAGIQRGRLWERAPPRGGAVGSPHRQAQVSRARRRPSGRAPRPATHRSLRATPETQPRTRSRRAGDTHAGGRAPARRARAAGRGTRRSGRPCRRPEHLRRHGAPAPSIAPGTAAPARPGGAASAARTPTHGLRTAPRARRAAPTRRPTPGAPARAGGVPSTRRRPTAGARRPRAGDRSRMPARLLSDLHEDRHLVAPRVRPHQELQHAARAVPEIGAERVLVVARETPHRLLDVQAPDPLTLIRFLDRRQRLPRHRQWRVRIRRACSSRPEPPSADRSDSAWGCRA